MVSVKGCIFLCLVMLSLVRAFPNPNLNNTGNVRFARRINIPALGIGPDCRGCPQRFCDDDPAIIHGYCCGCARFFGEPHRQDNLPIQCSTRIECPLNGYGLCEDYEYMMHCCC
ncbi:hypothetical protein WA026_002450 [Henosepilachna vigintioctopunctata]|uniref:Uncharacterized protein n=1 Tax=Henosepilachna vigintioctopunctata TaxID=420089 RepID=A0AAW1U2F5_9CUCU